METVVGSHKWIVRVITWLWNKYDGRWAAVVVFHPRVGVDMPSAVIENKSSPCKSIRTPSVTDD